MKIARAWGTREPKTPQTPQARATARAEADRRQADNDNAIAAQRARLAQLWADNDNVPRRFRGNARVLNMLAQQDPAAAWSVREYGRAVDAMLSAGLGDGQEEDPDQGEAEPYGSGSDIDRVHDMRPTINEMMADLMRVRVVSIRGTVLHRVDGMATRPAFDGYAATLAGMQFNYHPEARRPAVGGFMASYTDTTGRVRVPKYDGSKGRGAANDNAMDWCRITEGNPTATRPDPVRELPELVETNDVLEMVLAGASLQEIGTELGYGQHYADRGAWQAVRKAAEWAGERWPAPARAA